MMAAEQHRAARRQPMPARTPTLWFPLPRLRRAGARRSSMADAEASARAAPLDAEAAARTVLSIETEISAAQLKPLESRDPALTYNIMTLAEAQALGYAETPPDLDVDGIDTAHKLSLVAAVATGCLPNYEAVHTEGIR